MPPVFAHGRLRLYLLKLLDEAPRHGYEVIRLLEERFQGLYAPSAGTVYPRLAKLEAEGLVTHATEGGRKVYSITDAGRAELADRQGELADLEQEIRQSVAELAAEIREDVRGVAGDLRREMRAAAREARTSGGRGKGASGADGWDGSWGDREAWRKSKEELKRATEEWKEQARRAKEESRRAKEETQRARKQARDAQVFAREEVQRIVKRVQEQTQGHIRAGDWQSAVRDALSEVTREVRRATQAPAPDVRAEREEPADPRPNFTKPPATEDTGSPEDTGHPKVPEPDWAQDPGTPSADPARDLDRLLDRFRDDIRDASRDHGVTPDQLKQARHHLSTAATHIATVLRPQRD
ncbi:helix-turn-helix transcriptional regulator [Streptomyces pathocidini]|uniref:Helix-turn-helix transcriptional regulator n=1 Tax=Streptomyces pathocidini TaxID=1650571 RepID=A0ABW7UML7_9ACTN|nr:PadR family transcriptional regulator [Streptomyces pathocidini]